MTRATIGAAAAVAAALGVATMAFAGRPVPEAPATRAGPVLRAEYRVRLTSAWPVYPGESERCNNRGEEVLEGTLVRVADRSYAGRFRRETRLGFCGTHGVWQPEPCGLRLSGWGVAAVEAIASADGRELQLHWTPVREDTEVLVSGSCSAEFQDGLREMYLTAPHAIELPLPRTADPLTETLDDYGWVARVE